MQNVHESGTQLFSERMKSNNVQKFGLHPAVIVWGQRFGNAAFISDFLIKVIQ